MKNINFGTTSEKVSEICLGTMYFGSTVGEKQSFEMLDWYMDQGGNFIDTANNYAHWIPGCEGVESETLLGKWMHSRHNRNNLFLATKIGFDKKGIGAGLKAHQIEENCNKSLALLKTDTIDLLYAHTDDREIPLEETLEAFDRLIKAGKVRYIGASNHKTWRLLEALHKSEKNGYKQYCCIQNRHTYFKINQGVDTAPQELITDEMTEMCRDKGLQMLAYSPLLQGAYCLPRRPVPEGFQSTMNEKRFSRLTELASSKDATPNQMVFAWMMGNNIIPLMTGEKIEHLEENIKATQISLSNTELAQLNKA